MGYAYAAAQTAPDEEVKWTWSPPPPEWPWPPDKAPEIRLYVNGSSNPIFIEAPGSVTLNWEAVNARDVTINGVSKVDSLWSLMDVDVPASGATFEAVASNFTGTATDRATVTVDTNRECYSPNLVLTVNGSRNNVELSEKGTVTVAWSATNADTVLIDGTSVASSGSASLTVPTSGYRVSGEARNDCGVSRKVIKVTVDPDGWPPETPYPPADPPPWPKTTQTTGAYMWIVYPSTAPTGTYIKTYPKVANGQEFSLGVKFTESNDYASYQYTGTVSFELIDGDGSLAFTDADNTISFSEASVEYLSGVTYTMSDASAEYEDFMIRASATVDGEEIYDVRTFRCHTDYIDVALVDASGNSIDSLDMTADDDALEWVFYAKLTAMSDTGGVDTDFSEKVTVQGLIDYISQWSSGTKGLIVGYDENEIYNSETATEFPFSFDHLSIPASVFTSGDAGYASVKMIVTRAKAGQDPSAPYDDNTGYCDLIFAAKKEFT